MANCLQELGSSNYQSDQTKVGRSMGIVVFLYWTSLLRYLTYDSKIAHLPNTIVGSTYETTTGIIGLLPLFIGFGFAATTQFYMDFRFRDATTSVFTLFYNCNGDTLFDTLFVCNMWNPAFTFIWAYAAVQIALFVFMKISLAIIEEGYVYHRTKRQFDWIMKPEKLEFDNEEASGGENIMGVQIS